MDFRRYSSSNNRPDAFNDEPSSKISHNEPHQDQNPLVISNQQPSQFLGNQSAQGHQLNSQQMLQISPNHFQQLAQQNNALLGPLPHYNSFENSIQTSGDVTQNMQQQQQNQQPNLGVQMTQPNSNIQPQMQNGIESGSMNAPLMDIAQRTAYNDFMNAFQPQNNLNNTRPSSGIQQQFKLAQQQLDQQPQIQPQSNSIQNPEVASNYSSNHLENSNLHKNMSNMQIDYINDSKSDQDLDDRSNPRYEPALQAKVVPCEHQSSAQNCTMCMIINHFAAICPCCKSQVSLDNLVMKKHQFNSKHIESNTQPRQNCRQIKPHPHHDMHQSRSLTLLQSTKMVQAPILRPMLTTLTPILI